MKSTKQKLDSFFTRYLSGSSIGYKQIVAIFLPALLDQVFVASLSVINTAMISSSGVEAVSAVSMVDSLNLFLLNIFIAIATGGTVIVAQYKGKGDHTKMSKAASQAIFTTGFAATAFALILLLLQNPTLSFLFGAADSGVLDNANIYMTASYLSYPAFGIIQAISGALRGVGNTRGSLFISLVMNISYVLLNFIFINGLGMGVLGLSIALNSSRIIGVACALFFLLKLSNNFSISFKDLIKLDFLVAKSILLVGIPFAAEQLFFHGGKLLTQTFVVDLGTLALTTYAICNSLCIFLQVAGGATAVTTMTVIGQCMGNGNISDARKLAKSLVLFGMAATMLTQLLILPFLNPLISVFSPPSDIVEDIFTMMLVTALANVLLWPASFILPNALRAAGDTKFTSLFSMLSMWLARVVMGYTFGIVMGFGISGIWYAMLLEWGVRVIIFVLRFKGEKWCKHKLI